LKGQKKFGGPKLTVEGRFKRKPGETKVRLKRLWGDTWGTSVGRGSNIAGFGFSLGGTQGVGNNRKKQKEGEEERNNKKAASQKRKKNRENRRT